MLRISSLCPTIAIVAITLAAHVAVGQQPHRDIQQGLVDYPVPFPTAIRALLDESPSLLDPSTVRNSSVGIGSIWGGGSNRTSAGVEFAPFLIADDVGLSDYLVGRFARVLLRTRLSFAAMSDGEHLSPGIGLRFMLHDDADLRADSIFQRILLQLAHQTPGLDRRTVNTQDDSGQRVSDLTDAASREAFLSAQLDSIRGSLEERYWNLSVVEMAFDGVYHPIDSDGLAISRYAGYISAAFPNLGSTGQIVFGVQGWVGHSNELEGYGRKGSFILREYIGTAIERAYGECRAAWSSDGSPDYRVGVGTVNRLANGLWLRSDLGTSILLHARPEAKLTLTFGTPALHS